MSMSSIYIPNGTYDSFYYIRNNELVKVLMTGTGRVVYIRKSTYSCLRELQAELIEEGIFYIHSAATDPEEFISLHPELFI